MPFDDVVSGIACDLKDGTARNPGEDVIDQRWRGHLAAEHGEDVGCGCLGHVAIGGEQQGIVVATGVGVLGRQRGIHVGAGDLPPRGNRVVTHPLPARHGDPDAPGRQVVAEGDGEDADAVLQIAELHPDRVRRLVDDRADVGVAVVLVAAQQLEGDLEQVVGRFRHLRADQARIAKHSFVVLVSEEDGQPPECCR